MRKFLKIIISALTIVLLGSCGTINRYTYEDHEKYVTSSDFTLSDIINEVEVTWINGNVNILQDNLSSISVKEENYGNYPLFYHLDDTTLKIEFVEYGTKQSEFNLLNKDLTIILPDDSTNLIDIDVEIVNGNCNFISSTKCNDIEIDIVNGNINFETISSDEIDLKIVNGRLNVESIAANSLSLEKVNGDSTIKNMGKPLVIDINSVNGTDTIYIMEMFGYKVDYDSIGTFNSDFDDQKTYGNQLVEIDYNAANGNLIIKKQ